MSSEQGLLIHLVVVGGVKITKTDYKASERVALSLCRELPLILSLRGSGKAIQIEYLDLRAMFFLTVVLLERTIKVPSSTPKTTRGNHSVKN
jgi:hypothetical protein